MHLDLKPENILFCINGYYKICDFGCSQIAKASKMSGYESSTFGTFNYLPPEQYILYK
jgi:serine/threonine protein kinase